MQRLAKQTVFDLGSGCGSNGVGIALEIRGPQFESSHRKNLYMFSVNCIGNKNKEKEAGNGPFLKQKLILT